MTDLETRVRRLEAIERARAASCRYANVVDARDAQTLATSVFAADATLRARGRVAAGTAEITAFYDDALTRAPGLRRHFLTNQVAEAEDPAGDIVRVESYFLFLGCDDASAIGWGRYEDRVDTTGAQARIIEKTIHLDVRTDIDAGWAGRPTPA